MNKAIVIGIILVIIGIILLLIKLPKEIMSNYEINISGLEETKKVTRIKKIITGIFFIAFGCLLIILKLLNIYPS